MPETVVHFQIRMPPILHEQLASWAKEDRESPNAAEPQPKRTPARTSNAPRFAVVDTISSAVHPAIEALLSGPLVYVSGCYGCRTSA